MLIEIILGERPHPTPLNETQEPIRYFDRLETLQLTFDGQTVSEPIAPLRERFAKLKARDNLLGAVLARLGADPGASESTAHNAVNRVLNAQAALEKIAKGLGLSMGMYDLLASEVLAMNTELTAALSSSQTEAARLKEQLGGMTNLMQRERASHTAAREEASCQFVGRMNSAEAEAQALAEENARLRAEVEQERAAKLSAMTAADIAISRSAELEAEMRFLKSKATEADLGRIMAEATAAGMRTALQHLERALAAKLRT